MDLSQSLYQKEDQIDLPEELVIEILSRLPVKPLIRFRCVCKSWCALVETPSFISKHLNHKNKKNKNKNNRIDDDDDDDGSSSIIVKRRRDNKDSFLLLSYETLDVISADLGFQSLRDDRRVDHEFLGCCNGVICMYDVWYSDVILWNPATRQMKLVPESPIPHPKDSDLSGLEVGFGYDVKTNDYKVIRLVTFLFPHHDDRRGEQRTEVYSLSRDSWRLIDDVVPATCSSSRQHRTCVNGIYSTWGSGSVSDNGEWKEFVISFDMSKEVFLLTSLPECIDANGNRCSKAFTVLKNESFAIIQDISGMWNNFDVWLLNEYGPDGSWTKVYTTIGPFSDFLDLCPLGIWKNNELFFETSDGELVLGDPNTRDLKSLQVDGEYRYLEIILPYKESLVSIKGGNHPLP